MVCLQNPSVSAPVSRKPTYTGLVVWHIDTLLKVIAKSGDEEGLDQFPAYLPVQKSNTVTKGSSDASVGAVHRRSEAQAARQLLCLQSCTTPSFIISLLHPGEVKRPERSEKFIISCVFEEGLPDVPWQGQ